MSQLSQLVVSILDYPAPPLLDCVTHVELLKEPATVKTKPVRKSRNERRMRKEFFERILALKSGELTATGFQTHFEIGEAVAFLREFEKLEYVKKIGYTKRTRAERAHPIYIKA